MKCVGLACFRSNSRNGACVRLLSSHQTKEVPEELVDFTLGRARHERKDSITPEILRQRKLHLERIEGLGTPDKKKVQHLENEGFGSKKRLHGSYNISRQFFVPYQDTDNENIIDPSVAAAMKLIDKKSLMGAGGHAIHIGSASKNWPTFKHLLPEIAFAGHSNSGKSTLVNALVGVLPRHGPARVSDRAGWTDQICFYQLGKKPPVLTLVDLPGYGHSVATQQDKIVWTSMIRDYIGSRKVLTRCCVLVDSTRGLCNGDRTLLRFLQKNAIEWTVVLTKCDILSAEQLANSITLVTNDLNRLVAAKTNSAEESNSDSSSDENESVSILPQNCVWPVSSSTGAGINGLWHFLRKFAEKDSTPFINAKSVREHLKAGEERSKPRFEERQVARSVTMSNRVWRKLG